MVPLLLRRTCLCVAAVAMLASACTLSRPPPNVLLISIDCLNQRQFATALKAGYAPNLAYLAAQSLVFSGAHAHAPWTTPSHMSMLTGLYPNQHGRDVPYGLMMQFGTSAERVPTYQTLADTLSQGGYQSVAFVGEGSISGRFGLAKGFNSYHESTRKNAGHTDLPMTLMAVLSWLDTRAPGPFFLFFHTYDLHFPLPPERGTDEAAIRYVDAQLGQLFEALRLHGLWDSTAIFLTGDHGSHMTCSLDQCCVHGAGHYEENLNVPLVLKIPGVNRHEDLSQLVRHVDILPTVASLTGLSFSSYAGPGVALTDKGGRVLTTSAATVSFSMADGRCASRAAIRTDRFKYIYTLQDPVHQFLNGQMPFFDEHCRLRPACGNVPREELYDIEGDPTERNDLLKDLVRPDVEVDLRSLRALLAQNLNRPHEYLLEPAPRQREPQAAATMPEELKNSLKSLGYIE